MCMSLCVWVCARARARVSLCERACVRAYVRVCVRVSVCMRVFKGCGRVGRWEGTETHNYSNGMPTADKAIQDRYSVLNDLLTGIWVLPPLPTGILWETILTSPGKEARLTTTSTPPTVTVDERFMEMEDKGSTEDDPARVSVSLYKGSLVYSVAPPPSPAPLLPPYPLAGTVACSANGTSLSHSPA